MIVEQFDVAGNLGCGDLTVTAPASKDQIDHRALHHYRRLSWRRFKSCQPDK